MKTDEMVRIKLQSGCNVNLSIQAHDEYYCEFDESKYFSFSNIINSGLYFPQIMQFVCVMICIITGHVSFVEIFICNLTAGIGFTVAWFMLKLYKLPGINFLSCLIGGNIFRFFLHFIVIAIVSFFLMRDWKIFLFCLLGGLVTVLVRSFLFSLFSSVKYNDEVVKYVSRFKT